MIILAFDSTAKVASVAVCDGERLLASYSIDNGLTQSELLLPMAENILKNLRLGFSDVELLTCTVGPGSFTGVRIGAAVVKGLAFGRSIPCIEVSTLEALAQNAAGLDGIIVPVMDARRAQVYTALFRSSGNGIERITEDAALPMSELAALLRQYPGKRIYLVGDGYDLAKAALEKEGVSTESTPSIIIPQNAASCARIALKKYESGDSTTDVAFAPTYLRLPQAERERLERLNDNQKGTKV